MLIKNSVMLGAEKYNPCAWEDSQQVAINLAIL
jgi:hypothetical protein